VNRGIRREFRVRGGRWVVATAAAAAVLLVLSACSSSGAGGKATTAASGSGSNSATSDALTWARGELAEATARPTTIPVTTPVSKPIPKGKTVTYISCLAVSCTINATAFAQAAALLGWNFKVINTNGSPGQVKSAWQTIVQTKPDAVFYAGLDENVFATELPQVVANGTFVACSGCDYQVEAANHTGIGYANISPSQQGHRKSDEQAAWIIQDSSAKASTLLVNLTSPATLVSQGDEFVAVMKQHCPDCKTSSLDIPGAQIANAKSQIVSYLQAHPDFKYVDVTLDDLLAGLPAALQAAGLNGIKLVGASLNPTTVQYLRAGTISVDEVQPTYEICYTMIDAFARHLTGDPILQNPPVGLTVSWLVTPSTVPAGNAFPFVTVADYLNLWKKLWNLS
jgi:ABC-type sugar transport system substrate-binding protein